MAGVLISTRTILINFPKPPAAPHMKNYAPRENARKRSFFRSKDFHFAIGRQQLTQINDDPTFGWNNAIMKRALISTGPVQRGNALLKFYR